MTKTFLKKIMPSALVLAFVFSIGGFIFPQKIGAQTPPPPGMIWCQIGVGAQSTIRLIAIDLCIPPEGTPTTDPGPSAGEKAAETIAQTSSWWLESVLQPFLAWIVTLILKIVSLFTGLSAILLNGVLYYTVVNVANNYENIGVINTTWGVVRDIANMSFIFILLYAAIKTILGMGSGTQGIIVKVIIVAILINFSLFFTKVVIDISNVLALLLYESIVGSAALASAGTFDLVTQAGLGNQFMSRLALTSLMEIGNDTVLEVGSILTVGVMGSVMLLIATFIFFAVAIMFIIRYVVLILVLILSPLAFLGFILPEASKYKDQWLDALIGQAFFAPIYFLLTWITLKILGGVMSTVTGNFGAMATVSTSDKTSFGQFAVTPGLVASDPGVIAMFINFAIVIVFLIASLVIAKEYAGKAGTGVNKFTGWVNGVAGGATFGAAGWAGRQTIGRAGQALAESEGLKKAQDRMVARGGIRGTLGNYGIRKVQEGAGSVGSASFDTRASRGYGAISGATKVEFGKAGGKGGYEAWRKEQDKKEKEYVDSQAPSAKTKAKVGKDRDAANEDIVRYERELRNSNLTPDARQEIERGLAEARTRRDLADNILGNKKEIEERVKSQEKEKIKQAKKIEDNDDLRAAVVAEKSAQDTVNRLEAEAKAAVGSAQQSRLELAVEAAKENLKRAQNAANEIRRINRDAVEKSNSEHDNRIEEIKKSQVKSAEERRKGDHADLVENSTWAKIRGYNYTAAAAIRKDKKPLDKIKEILEDGEPKKDEDSGTPPETPSLPSEG